MKSSNIFSKFNLTLFKLFFIEGILILIACIGLLKESKHYYFDINNMTNNFGTLNESNTGFITNSTSDTGHLVDFLNIELPKGVYTISLHYNTDTDLKNKCNVSDNSSNYKTLLSNGEYLFSGLNETNFNVWILNDTSSFNVHAFFVGEGYLEITGLEIHETKALIRIIIFNLFILSLIVNGVFLYFKKNNKYGVAIQKKNTIVALFIIILFTSLPLMTDYMLSGGDLVYHLMRIEGIKDGILAGQFPVRIAPEWQQGYGYASSIFYGETVLYLASIFRLVGFSVTTSYRLFFLCINITSVLIAYFCFNKIFKNNYISLISTTLYSLSIYRIFKTFNAGAFGECFGIMFLPFLVYGFFRVFSLDVNDKTYNRSWIPLTIGFAGIIQSHLLTGEIAGFFTILLCIIMIKKVVEIRTFIVLAKSFIYSILLSLWFLVPFIDYMANGNFVIQNVSARTIQDRGLYIAHLLLAFPKSGNNVFYSQSGMVDSQATTIGISLLMVLVLWIFISIYPKKSKLKSDYIHLGNICVFFSVLSMIMSLNIFPWDKIQKLNDLSATLVSSLQFPNRILMISTICLSVLAGVIAKWILKEFGHKFAYFYFGGMVVLTTVSSLYLMGSDIYKKMPIRVYNSEGMGTGYVSGGEYLPFGAKPEEFMPRNPIISKNIILEAYDKNHSGIIAQCKVKDNNKGIIELPLLYYKGYKALSIKDNRELKIFSGNNFLVTVELEGAYEGTFYVKFVSPWYWRISEIISMLFFILLVVNNSIIKEKMRMYIKSPTF